MCLIAQTHLATPHSSPAPLHSTPLHSTPLHFTPLHSTPLHHPRQNRSQLHPATPPGNSKKKGGELSRHNHSLRLHARGNDQHTLGRARHATAPVRSPSFTIAVGVEGELDRIAAAADVTYTQVGDARHEEEQQEEYNCQDRVWGHFPFSSWLYGVVRGEVAAGRVRCL